MPDLQLRYHVHNEQKPEVKEQQQDERREYDPFPDAGREVCRAGVAATAVPGGCGSAENAV